MTITDEELKALGPRLRQFFRLTGAPIIGEAASAIEQSVAEIERLREALTEMEAMYSHAWDRAGGGLLMMPKSVERFDEACRKARIALGKPLYGDNGELDEDDRAALPEKLGEKT